MSAPQWKIVEAGKSSFAESFGRPLMAAINKLVREELKTLDKELKKRKSL